MPEAGTYRAYTDGGAEPNPGVGGWGLVLVAPDGAIRDLHGGELDTTNNRMELLAAISALEEVPEDAQLEIFTDSRYVQRGVTEWLAGWKRRGFARADGPLANADLWRRLDAAVHRRPVRWSWLKGHAGHTLNERADALATRGRLELGAVAPPRAAAAPPIAIPTGAPEVLIKVSGGAGGARWTIEVIDSSGEPRRLSGRAAGASTNRSDLLAALAALEATSGPVVLHSGSDYLRHGATEWIKGWKARGWTTKEGKPVANADLWQQLDRAARGRQILWPKVTAVVSARLAALAAPQRG